MLSGTVHHALHECCTGSSTCHHSPLPLPPPPHLHIVHIHFDKGDVGVLLRHLGEHGPNHLAGTAPLCMGGDMELCGSQPGPPADSCGMRDCYCFRQRHCHCLFVQHGMPAHATGHRSPRTAGWTCANATAGFRGDLTVAEKSTTTPLPPKLLALSAMILDHCAASAISITRPPPILRTTLNNQYGASARTQAVRLTGGSWL